MAMKKLPVMHATSTGYTLMKPIAPAIHRNAEILAAVSQRMGIDVTKLPQVRG